MEKRAGDQGGLPNGFDLVVFELRVDGEDGQPLHKALGNQDAVKRILFEGADIQKELTEKEYYLNMLYYG